MPTTDPSTAACPYCGCVGADTCDHVACPCWVEKWPNPKRMPTYCMAIYPNLLGDGVPCQEARGHEGPHRYQVVWFADA